MNKLRALPASVLAAVIIAAAVVTGGLAYAVYKTVIEPLEVEQTRSVTESNKNKTTFAVYGCPSADGVSQKEITTITNENSGISSDEAKSYVVARCEQNAIDKYAHDAVAARGIVRYDSSVLSTTLPVVMPAMDATEMKLDVGPRIITSDTQFYKGGHLVRRSDIPAGSLVHVAYAGVPSKQDKQTKDKVLAVVAASVGMKYYVALYDNGNLIQRVPCRNNQSESCLSDLPGRTFYSAISADTGPVPAGEERYVEAMNNHAYIELGGVVTYINGNAYTFCTSTGRSVTFHLPEDELKRERAPEQALPEVGTEIIITTIGNDRDAISSSDLLSAYSPIIPN